MLKNSDLSVETQTTNTPDEHSTRYKCILCLEPPLGSVGPLSVSDFLATSDYRKGFPSCLSRKSVQSNDFFDQWWKQKETLYLASPENHGEIKSLNLQLDSGNSPKNADSLGKREFLGFILNSNKSFSEDYNSKSSCKVLFSFFFFKYFF